MTSDRPWNVVDAPRRRGEPSAPAVRSLTTLSTREAAAALGISEQAVRQAITRGSLAAVKRGRAYRVGLDDVGRYARRRAGIDAAKPRALLVALPSPPVSTLPTPASRFVGREKELADLTAFLADPGERLITLTGPGGIGKTRLALTAAAAMRDRFPDGIHFADLAATTSPRSVVPVIAETIGLRERTGQDRHSQLTTFLHGKRILLVVDNFEHVLDAAPDVARLLAEAPSVSVLVTSRAPLRIGGERELPVPPLSLAGTGAAPDALLASDAARLFVERAREHDPGFTVGDAAATDIASICSRLDGLPLAIELAAARSKTLTPRALRDRLEPRLPLLTRGPRDAPARLRTMRDAIAWSYDLLTADEQRVFRRLAVFAGGCTLEAAQTVLAIGDADHDDAGAVEILDPIGSLVDQSLLMRELGPEGEPRFRMLETIREYGLDRLEGDEVTRARAAHAEYFLRFARSLRLLSNTQAMRAPHERLAADNANLRAALGWLEAREMLAEVARMVAACWVYWYASGQLHEGEAWLTRALSRLDTASEPDRARLLIAHAELLMIKGETAPAEAAFAKALPRIREVGAPFDLALALKSCGASLNHSGKYAQAEPYLHEAVSVAETIPDPKLRAALAGGALSNLIESASGQGDLALATERGEEALRRFRGQDLDLAEPRTLVTMAEVATQQGNHLVAWERYLAYIKQIDERDEMRVVAIALAGVASAATAWGHSRAALMLFGAAEALRERAGIPMSLPVETTRIERHLATLHAALDEREFETSLAEGRALPLPEAIALATAISPPGSGRPLSHAEPQQRLTRREREILLLLAESRTDREIAEALFLSPRTVNWHVGAILDKLGAASRREAIAKAWASGVIASS